MSKTARQILSLIRRGHCAEAKQVLLDMGVDALPVLRELLERPLRAEKKSRLLHWLLPMLTTPFLIFALCGPPEYEGGMSWKWYEGMTPMSLLTPWPLWVLTCLVMSIMPGLFVAIGVNLGLYVMAKSYRGLTRTLPHPQGQELAAQVLTQMKDVSAVGLLLEMLYWLKERIPKTTLNAGREALIRLLPDLTLETALSLTQDQRKALLGLLRTHSGFVLHIESEEKTYLPFSPYYLRLSLAILQVYRWIGDPTALEFVERLATATAQNHFSTDGKQINKTSVQLVIDKAASVLPKLRAHCEALRTGESLLRAASKPEAAPEELLRPTQGSKETPPEQLLRAGLGHSDPSSMQP